MNQRTRAKLSLQFGIRVLYVLPAQSLALPFSSLGLSALRISHLRFLGGSVFFLAAIAPCPSLSLLMFAVGVTPTLQKALSCKVSLKMIHHQLPSVGGPTFGSGNMHALCPPHPNLSKHQPFSGKLLLDSILLLWVGTSVSSKSREHRSTSLVDCFPYPTIESSSAFSVHAEQEKDLAQGLYPRSPAEG